MNEIQIFKNVDFGEIRGITIENEPWFVGKDVADVLGYSNTRDALARHVDADDKNTVVNLDGNRGNPNMVIINESGLYSLILSSKLPKAKEFKHWVTSEVLPSIRKTGGYVNNDGLFIDTYLPFADDNTKLLFSATLKTVREQNNLIKKQKYEIKEMKPKAEYHDNVLNKADLITTTVIAKDLGLSSAAKLNEILHKNKIIFKNQSGTWCPYSNYEWLIEEEYCDYKSYEDKHTKPCLKWTEKGRKWILDNYDKWVKRCA